MSTQHTPTPWRVTIADPVTQPDVLPCIDATDNRGEIACGVFNEADARFIVRACNSHDALVAALRATSGIMSCLYCLVSSPRFQSMTVAEAVKEMIANDAMPTIEQLASGANKARAALAAAEVQS